MEIWKAIKNFEGRYEVSDQGRVRSLDMRVRCVHGSTRSVKGRVLKPGPSRGYPSVVLGRGNTRMVHALVAEAFIGPRPENHDVMHLDGSRTNNAVGNLRYGTRSENNRQVVHDGRRKLSSGDVGHIYEMLKIGVKGTVVADLFGISESQVSNIRTGKNYAHLTY